MNMGKRNTRGGLLNQALAELRMKMICDALVKFRGNKNAAAKYLGVERTTLLESLRSHGRHDLIGEQLKGGKNYVRGSDGLMRPVVTDSTSQQNNLE